MRERFVGLPRSLRVAALLMLVVPAVLWVFLVWDTRPYSPEEIAADRARVEALPAYDRAVDGCSYADQWLAEACERVAFDEHTDITREDLRLDPEASSWVTLSLAALAFTIGTRWPIPPGARALLARAGGVFAFGTIAALAISLLWWWGLEWIAVRRGLEDTTGPSEMARRASLVVGLSGVLGLAFGQLMRGRLRVVLTVSAVAVALGLVVLISNPIEPWLPLLNIEAFLYGDQSYDIPRTHPCEPPGNDPPLIPLQFNEAGIHLVSTSDCLDPSKTRTAGGAGFYLFGTTGLLLAAASLSSLRRRGTLQPV